MHGAVVVLQEFGPNIWIVDGPTVTAAAGFHYPTRMTVIRLSSGDLVLWSPTAVSDDLCGQLQALGVVRYLVPPNSLHHTFLADWQQAYPEAAVFAPPGLREKRTDTKFDGEFADGPVSAWAGEIDLAIVWGNRITTEVVLFHRQSATTVFTDLIQQFSPGWFGGWRAIVARLDLMVAHEPMVPRKFRIAFADRSAARKGLRTILSWPTRKVLLAHGTPVTENGQAFLRRAFRWLAVA